MKQKGFLVKREENSNELIFVSFHVRSRPLHEKSFPEAFRGERIYSIKQKFYKHLCISFEILPNYTIRWRVWLQRASTFFFLRPFYFHSPPKSERKWGGKGKSHTKFYGSCFKDFQVSFFESMVHGESEVQGNWVIGLRDQIHLASTRASPPHTQTRGWLFSVP